MLITDRGMAHLNLGNQGEYGVKVLSFDCAAWFALWPAGTLEVSFVTPSGTFGLLPVSQWQRAGDTLSVTVMLNMTFEAGFGSLNVRLLEGGDVQKRSAVFKTYVVESHSSGTGVMPDVVQEWVDAATLKLAEVDTALDLTEAATLAANNAAGSVNTAITNAETATGLADAATLAANTATGLANTATQSANDAALLANTKAGLADSKASLADSKATLANNAAALANEKAALADTKAGLADTAAQNADTATGLTNAAISGAETATGLANTATQNANTATGLANTATQNANTATQAALDGVIVGAEFSGDDINFTKADATIVPLVGAKVTLKGETGDPAVHVGTTAPTDPNKTVWIDTDEAYDVDLDAILALIPLTGSGAPSANAGYVGQIYIDTAGFAGYMAVKTGTGAGDWKQVTA